MNNDDLAKGIAAGERRALARGITLVESGRDDHRAQATELLAALPKGREALRIGLSGTPGVGKSTFIESFGMMLIRRGLKVAVLAIDPSSSRSGGSILGDKTRMDLLSRERDAFIRPSPSQTHLGGVARRTREAVTLCEAAGFDVVLIETVGVGQSETVVAEMSDVFLLLLAPAGGDELQGVKRGIMEMADIIVINKADGDLKPAASRTCADYAGALEENGLNEAWAEVEALTEWRRAEGFWQHARAAQARYWFEQAVKQALLAQLEKPKAKAALTELSDRVAQGLADPTKAAQDFVTQLDR